MEAIEYTRTKTRHPQANGICERLHKTMLNEFYRTAFRRTLYPAVEALQQDLAAWLVDYNGHQAHQGKYCYGKTPWQTFLGSSPTAKEQGLHRVPPDT